MADELARAARTRSGFGVPAGGGNLAIPGGLPPPSVPLQVALAQSHRLLGFPPEAAASESPGDAYPIALEPILSFLLVETNPVLQGETLNAQDTLLAAVRAVLPVLGNLDSLTEGHWSDPLGLVQVGGVGPNVFTANAVGSAAIAPSGVRFDERALLLNLDLGGDDRYEIRAGGASPVEVALPSALADAERTAVRATWAALGGLLQVPADARAQSGAWETALDALVDPALLVVEGGVVGVPVSVSLDLSGDDHYETAGFGQGAGIAGGVGLLVDVEGDDTYVASELAQGAGAAGEGLLIDLGGADAYRLVRGGQGFSIAQGGSGRLLDAEGDDVYVGMSCVHRVGVSMKSFTGAHVDFDGDDAYEGSLSGGVGIGGGVGLLANLGGDDRYGPPGFALPGEVQFGELLIQLFSGKKGASFAHGVGLAGTGILHDARGDDAYPAFIVAQGATVMGGRAGIFAREGDDVFHVVAIGQASALLAGFAALVDGAGNDRRACLALCQAAALNPVGFPATPEALLVDVRGGDTYACEMACQAIAAGSDPSRAPRARLLELDGPVRYFAGASAQGHAGFEHGGASLGAGDAVFVDARGKDVYGGSEGSDGTSWRRGGGMGIDAD